MSSNGKRLVGNYNARVHEPMGDHVVPMNWPGMIRRNTNHRKYAELRDMFYGALTQAQAKLKGAGLFGEAWLVPYAGPVETMLKHMMLRASKVVRGVDVPSSITIKGKALPPLVIIKVARYGERKRGDMAMSDGEAHAMKYIQDLPRRTCLPNAADHVPKLYCAFSMAGTAPDVVGKQYMSVIVMEYIPGIPLSKAPATAQTYMAAEEAVVALAAAGIVHSDAHKDNVIYVPSGPRVVFIDLGLTFRVRRTIRNQFITLLRRVAEGDQRANAVWLQALTNTATKTARGQGRQGYYQSDGLMLQHVWSRVPEAHRERLMQHRAGRYRCLIAQG